MTNKKTRVIYKLALKGYNVEFEKGLGKGVIIEEIVDFDGDRNNPLMIKAIYDYEQEFIEKYINVIIEEG